MWEKRSRRSVALVLAIAIAAGLLAPGLRADAQVEPTLTSGGGLRILVVESSEQQVTVDPGLRADAQVEPGGLRILVVESHDQQVTVDPGRAGEINAANPEFELLRFDAIDASAQVDRLTTFLTSVDLEPYDIVVIPCPSGAQLSPQESDAVTAFLNGGGGLLLMGYSGCGGDFGTLGSELGFAFDPTVVSASAHQQDPQSFWLPEVLTHQVTSGIDGIQVNWGGSFTFDEAWQVLARTGADSWIDSETNGIRDADETGGPFDSLAVRDFGEGRVVAIADSLAFLSYGYPWELPAKVAGNILAWLAGANAFTAPPAGGLTQGAAGTTSFQSLIVAQTFDVESVWKLDIATQAFQSYVPGGLEIANSLKSISATDIVTLKSK